MKRKGNRSKRHLQDFFFFVMETPRCGCSFQVTCFSFYAEDFPDLDPPRYFQAEARLALPFRGVPVR